ncbi:Bug family tripartite tricarboxylate transporter substrate binding protein [Variovorax terrae]|uniref:Tripartite tricarboxylate transporter substrate binding protein n=1 Tax=Variovorax terrae TaxID=2923278 RepID=A0A9X2ALM8_9BURK|nr:tripartite tricarboxylate transporter substrate binding protein [Variovorax terrae]MCJ0762484.1 tripartite tricarboxylate transporter substrate binding protein [Variovorax terrae]
MPRWIATAAVIATALVSLPLTAAAQEKWPAKAIEIIYTFPPGNDADAVFRVLAQGMSKRLGVPVQVINKPGGGGVVGTAELTKAKPDGYTIGSWTAGPGVTQVLAGNTPYKQADYAPLAGVFVNDFVLAARGDIPASNLKEFAVWAKAQGKPIIIGSYAAASSPALIAAKIARQDGWPYKIVAFPNPSAKELTAGDADLATTGAEMAAPFARAKQIKVLSTWMPTRSKHYPDTATLKEAGYGERFPWIGLIAPANTPRDITHKLSETVREAMGDKEMVDLLGKLGVPALYMTPEQMAQRIQSDTQWMGELMTELGMTKK